ncbi:hypothetical protein CEUSTIGMA_g3398.t1 [Chlamydomonas eustigma]|uniref:Uncharacterized protein n=1 Tax=Chlamydomonas eustigma TaxID=1157962 RepID=A0A250WYU6_9CHLO|nr:hypothetical protein CEUSTIGMA_g3398.t1 [Chlamydomonas eustigma]|eukprot:GAX75955.1 hypothetical protein CEUSTIGMA_g3398.t1 [Chlamydomonas eustigma]
MKRGFECFDGSTSSTPTEKLNENKSLKAVTVTKRAKTTGIRGFLQTPFLSGFPSIEKETPGTFKKPTSRDVWPTSAQRKFEGLGLTTPSEELLTTLSLRIDSGPSSSSTYLTESQRSDALCMPAEPEDEDEDFVLFSQTEYVRGSQAACTPAHVAGAPSNPKQAASTAQRADMHGHDRVDEVPGTVYMDAAGDSQAHPSTLLPLHLSLAAEDDHEEEGQADSQPCILSLPDRHTIPAVSASRPALCTSDLNTAVTPELNAGCLAISSHQEDAVSNESISANPQATRMFNIFVPKSQQRYIIYIRHGESEYNRAVVEGKDFKDPMIFDPALTARGIAQAQELRSKLQQQLSAHGEALWVVSPLRRAIETFLQACPLLHNAAAPGLPSSSLRCSGGCSTSSGSAHPMSSASTSSRVVDNIPVVSHGGDSMIEGSGVGRSQAAISAAVSPLALRVELLPLISEFVTTAGDVGSSTSCLSEDFPMLSGPLSKIPEQWWYQAPKKANCAHLKELNSLEPKESRQKRVSELTRWLSSRPERFIIMIGHSSFWHEFRGRAEKRMNNGEMRCMRW